MRPLTKFLTIAAAAFSFSVQSASAGLIGAPQALRSVIRHIKFDLPTVAPMAHTQFCLRYAAECKARQQPIFRSGRVKLNAERWEALRSVNREVNAAIRFETNAEGLSGEKWIINPSTGDCNDYAVSKRHELMARGWSARSLLLSEVATSWGEHHLVLVVRTSAGDLVLDNIGGNITPWSHKAYQWLRIQTPANPKYWSAMSERAV